ncbi:MAG: PTS sugar transporter subunit IIA [Candidatus Edwardsbacteria bacterium]|nr:PTS sugar transporter subunit IIA [Candidatus Edwardsbacteria bacterium]
MKIEDILNKQRTCVFLSGQNKKDIIAELVGLMVKDGLISDGRELLDSAMEREGLMSTGIGKGVAIPHGRTKGLKKMAGAFGLCRNKIDFGSLDGQPVQIFFFIATPQSIIADHVKALALVSRLLNREEIRARLLAADDPQKVMDIFLEAEKGEVKT